MGLNLRVEQLETFENLVSQKCLVSCSKFPSNARPGMWAKCVLVGGGYSVCQIYPSDDIPERLCFMDKCVAAPALDTKTGRHRLHKLELLQEVDPPEKVEITFLVTEELFSDRNLPRLSLDYLKTMAHTLVQSMHLTVGATVCLPDLLTLGVAGVTVLSASGCVANSTFMLSEEQTELSVADIHKQQPGSVTAPSFDAALKQVFERPLKQLQDLLEVAKLQHKQRESKRDTFRMSLNALLVGATGSGKSSLVAAFCKENSCNCFTITAANVMRQFPGETEKELRRVFKAARIFKQRLEPKAPTVILIEDLHLICPAGKPSSTDTTNYTLICAQLFSLLDELYNSRLEIVCLATTSQPESVSDVVRRPGRFEHEIGMTAPTAPEREKLLDYLYQRSSLAEHFEKSLSDDLLEQLTKQTQGYVLSDLALLVRNVEQEISRDTTLQLVDAVEEALKKSVSTSVRNTDVRVLKPDQGFDVIGGMDRLKQLLKLSVFSGFGDQMTFSRFGLSMPKGILLYGPPGCAKTTFVKCLAAEAAMTLIATSGAEVYSPYVGCAEKFVAKIFDTARRNAPCVIFLDEIDTLIGSRALEKGGSSDVQTRILATLLTEMDGITTGSDQNILVVAATNRPDMIDDALMRPGRFDRLIHVPAPDFDSRVAILELHAERMPFAADVDLATLAYHTENYSGADICDLCNEAAIQALQRDLNSPYVEAEDFRVALRTHVSSLSKEQIDRYIEFEMKTIR